MAVGECPRGLLLQGGAESEYESFLMDMTSYCVVRGIGVRGEGMGSAFKCNRSCTWRYIYVSLGQSEEELNMENPLSLKLEVVKFGLLKC